MLPYVVEEESKLLFVITIVSTSPHIWAEALRSRRLGVMDAQAFLVELRVLIGGPLIKCKQVRLYTCVSYKRCEEFSLWRCLFILLPAGYGQPRTPATQ